MSPMPGLATTHSGLSTDQARELLETHGPNRLPVVKGRSALRQLFAQFFSFFAALLWVAGALAFVAGLAELGVAIFGVIVLNGGFAFIQEHRAERAGDRLREIVPRRATVIRDGRPVEIDSDGLVPGDLVSLAGGDRIGADMTALETHSVTVDEAILTGESVPTVRAPGDRLYSGTFVVEGEGLARVDSTGRDTRLAAVADLTTRIHRPQTPLAKEIRRLVRTTTIIAVGVGVAFLAIATILGMEVQSGLVFGIGVMVALVPEALLPTVTLSLAIGAQRMATHHALVRRLEAVETLGSTTFLCTDKTGTLTQNRMAVVEVWTPLGTATIRGTGYEPAGELALDSPAMSTHLEQTALAAGRCSTGRAILEEGEWIPVGDPMEAALDVFARRVGVSVEVANSADPEIARFPFDPRRRRMTVATRTVVCSKGAPDSLFPICTNASQQADEAVEDLSRRGLRVLAVAVGETSGHPQDAKEVEHDLRLLALIGLEDPPRPAAAASVAACRSAGVKIALITGDHPSTAKAIADEVGLYVEGAPVLTGAQLPPDDEVLGALLDRDGAVISRVTPEDKVRIAHALRNRGHVVAMTGDGVNDGPALREADIGVAMGRSGTDVAREAADLVLLDDDLATIVAAIGQGRAVFINARRFLTYHLTDNVAELTPFLIWALSGSRIPLALGVLQILALDLGTDTLSATALGAEPSHRAVSEGRPVSGRLLDKKVAFRSFGILGPTEAFAEMTAFFAVFLAAGWRPGQSFPESAMMAASGAAFATVVLAQTANAFACRSTTRPVWRMPFLGNRLLIVAGLIELALAGLFLLADPIAEILGHQGPPVIGWVIALGSMPLLIAVDGAHKWFISRHARAIIE
jgi:calcium-translocating P-type ATPase